MELVDFLRARLDEDEAVARRAHEYASPEWHLDEEYGETVLWWPPEFHTRYEEDKHWRGLAVDGSGIAPHIARHDPARVLAEVEAKRALLDDILAEPHATLRPGGSTEIYCDADSGLGEPCECGRDARVSRHFRLHARAYRAHPDFDPAWLED